MISHVPNPDAVREKVRAGYSQIALQGSERRKSSCCSGMAAVDSEKLARQIGYGAEELAALPEGANIGLSCGKARRCWRYLTDGDPAYTLVQVAVNDLIMLVAFAPIVMFLCGVAHVVVPAKVLITSVVVFIVIPLTAGWLTRTALLRSHGKEWFEQRFLPKFHLVMIGALLLTLVLIFAFQSKNLTSRWVAVLLIALPIILQVYFNSGLTYLLMRWLRVEHNVASPGALIGASNFFELAVAVAITLFGSDSPAALATVVGVLVEVPVMLSVCNVCNRTRGWYGRDL
jgi:ACR3 family arsenite transporter